MRSFLPLLTFIGIFLGCGFYFTSQNVDFAFYQVSAPVAVLPAIILAFLVMKGRFENKLTHFMEGLGDINVLTMCVIYLLAGAFGAVVKSVGGVDAAIFWGLKVIPEHFLLPGFFILAALISTSIGTSMGTISALGPIALGMATTGGMDKVLFFGTLVGGAMFGDNLSFISDTTIAATRSQGCSMKDKFRTNFRISLPAAIVSIIIILTMSATSQHTMDLKEAPLMMALPYLIVLILALSGMNVFLVLVLGILIALGMGIITIPTYTLLQAAKDIWTGFKDMQEIFLLSMFMGGLAHMMKADGGIGRLQKLLKSMSFKSPKLEKLWGEASISFSVILANLAVANNTVAILITGDLAREVARTEKVPPARSASLLDIYSCVIQGIIPYGAQVLLACQIAKLSPVELAGKIYYCYILGAFALVSMFWRAVRPK